MTKPAVSLLMFAALAAGPINAQPHILSVVSGADFTSGIALGGLGTVFGTGLSDSQYQFAALPFPLRLGPTEAFICVAGKISQLDASQCQALQLIFASPSQINFILFSSLPAIPQFQQLPGMGAPLLSLVVRVNGVIDDGAASGSSAGSQVELTQYGPNPQFIYAQPRIFSEGYDCVIDPSLPDANKNCGLTFTKTVANQSVRGAITDQQGHVLSSSNPARIGQYYTIWLTGLGTFVNSSPKSPVTMNYEVPEFGQLCCTYLEAAFSFVGPSPQFPGLYQVNFQLPATITAAGGSIYAPAVPFPCGNYEWELWLDLWQGAKPGGVVGFGSYPANRVQLPVVVKLGDVACPQ